MHVGKLIVPTNPQLPLYGMPSIRNILAIVDTACSYNNFDILTLPQ